MHVVVLERHRAQAPDASVAAPIALRSGLLLAGVVYLVAECAFNVNLVGTAMMQPSDRLVATDRLATAGKVLSGIGLALLLVRLSVPPAARYAAARILLIGAASVAAMWWAQTRLIETLTEVSTPAARRDAFVFGQLVDVLTARTAQSATLQWTSDTPTAAAATVLGFLPFIGHRSELLPQLRPQLPAVLARRVTVTCVSDVDARCDCAATQAALARARSAVTATPDGAVPIPAVPDVPFLFNCVYLRQRAAFESAYERYADADRRRGRSAATVARECVGFKAESENCRRAIAALARPARIPGLGDAVPWGLDHDAFIARPGVRSAFARALRDAGLVDAVPTGACAAWSLVAADRFKQCLHAPLLARAVDTLQSIVDAPARAFADGGRYVQVGRTAYQATIVVPLALSFSLAFAVLNAAALLTSLIAQVVSWLPGGAALGPARRAAMQLGIAAVAAGVLCLAPNPVLTHPAVADAVHRSGAGLAPPLGELVRGGLWWVLRAEPQIYDALAPSLSMPTLLTGELPL